MSRIARRSLRMGEDLEHLLPRTRAYAEIWLDQEKGDH
jgi:hypothetical protein